MATAAAYAATPRTEVAQVSAANTNRDGSGTLVTVMAGGASGSRVDDITIKAVGTTTAGMVRLYLSLDNGVTNRLLLEVPVSAITPSASVASFTYSLRDLGLILDDANALLRASTHNAEAFNILVTRAGNF